MSNDITIRLNLDSGQFTTRIRGASDELSRFRATVGQSNRAVKQAESAQHSWGRSLRDLVVTVGLARHALINLNDLVLGLPRSFIRANAELERMKMLMIGMDNSSKTFEEANAKAAKSVEGIYDMAKRAPFEVGALTDSFVKLKAAGLEPAAGSIQALVDSVARFGGTSEQLKRASVAIQQMSGKGVISMEELRQQLGEAVPNAVAVMARAVNMSMGDLVKQISTGTVEAKSALALMFRQMTLENGGAALIMTDTWDGAVNRMKTRWIELQKVVGEAGFFDAAKNSLNSFLDDFMNTREATAIAHDLGVALARMVKGMVELTKFLYAHADAIKKVITAYIAWKAVSMFMATTGIRSLASAVAASTATLAAMTGNIKRMGAASMVANSRFNMMAGTMITRGAMARGAIALMGRGILALAGPIGATVAVAWTLWEAFSSLGKVATDTGKKFKDMSAEFISAKDVADATKRADKLRSKIDEIGESVEKLQAKNERRDSRTNIYQRTNNRIKTLLRRIKRYGEELQGIEKKLTEVRLHDQKLALDRELREQSIAVEKKLKAYRVGYEKSLGDLREYWFSRTDIDKSEAEKGLKEARKSLDDGMFDQMIEAAQQKYELAMQAMARAEGDLAKGAAADAVAGLREELERLENARNAGDLVLLDSKQKSSLQGWMDATIVGLGKLDAKIEQSGERLAEFYAKQSAGDFAGSTDEELEKAESIARSFDRRQEAVNKLREAMMAYERNAKRVTKLDGIISKLEDRNDSTNPWLKKQSEVKQYTVELEALLEKMQQFHRLQAKEGGDTSDVKAKMAEIQALLDRSQNAGPGIVIGGMEKDTIGFNESLLTQQEQITAKYSRMRQEARDWRAEQHNLTEEQVSSFNAYMVALDQVQARMEETPVEKLFRTWEDSGIRFQNVWADAIDGFSTQLTNALVKGEADFKSFAESIVAMIVKIALQKQIAGLVDSVMGGITVGSSSATRGTVYGQKTDAWMAEIGAFANGGIMTSKGALPLEKYAKGGIANRPQVALFGEGSTPEAFVPLPDGRRIPVNLNVDNTKEAPQGGNVQVNVLNQGQPAQAEASSPRFDGEKFVVDVIMREAAKPGPLRDTLKGGW